LEARWALETTLGIVTPTLRHSLEKEMFVVYNKKTGLVVDTKKTIDEAAMEAKRRNSLSVRDYAFCSENTFVQYAKTGVGNWRGARTVC